MIDEKILSKIDAQLGEIIWYNSINDPRVHNFSIKRANQIKQFLDKKNYKPKIILEIGVSDRYTVHLLSSIFNCEAYAIDISYDAMKSGLNYAKSKIKKKFNYFGVACDYHQIPFEDNYFDFVYSYSTLHHTNKMNVVLKEITRVLRKNSLYYMGEEPLRRKLTINLNDINRIEDYTSYEKELKKKKLLNFIRTDVAFGSGREKLFGIIENHSLDIDYYLKHLNFPKIIEKKIDCSLDTEDIEYFNKLILSKGSSIVKKIIKKNITICNSKFSKVDKSLNHKKINKQKNKTLSNLITSNLNKKISKKDFVNYAGGVISYMVCLNTKNSSLQTKIKNIRVKKNQIVTKPITIGSNKVYLNKNKLADINDLNEKNNKRLKNYFSEKDWEKDINDNNIVFHNRTNECFLNLPKFKQNGLLLIKIFCYVLKTGYDLLIKTNGVIKKYEIEQTKSFPLKMLVSKNKSSVVKFNIISKKNNTKHCLKISGIKFFEIKK